MKKKKKRKKREESRYNNMYRYESVDYSIGDVWHIVWEQSEGIWLACLSMIVNMKKRDFECNDDEYVDVDLCVDMGM